MTCCGNLIDISTMDDRTPHLMCQECGKQGPPSTFPDPPEEPAYSLDPPKPSRIQHMRRAIGRVLGRLKPQSSSE